MVEKESNVEVEFLEDKLHVEFDYQVTQTKVGEEQLRDFYQWRFSQRAGKEVPREEIEVSPKEGDVYTTTMSFQVKIGEPLYVGLWGVPEQNREALPKLVDFLTEYQQNRLNERERRLVDWVIKGLNEITNPPASLPEGIQDFIEYKRNQRGGEEIDRK